MKYQKFFLLGFGVILPTVLVLLMDIYEVKVSRTSIDLGYLSIALNILATPLIFLGIKKITNEKIYSALLAILSLILLVPVNLFLLFIFHLWIGGQK